MFIKNQRFSDEETLMEVLFDFSLGEPAPHTSDLYAQIDKELEGNTAYQEYRSTLDEDDRIELESEERDMRLAEVLMEQFEAFVVKQSKLYGVKGAEETLLYEMNLH